MTHLAAAAPILVSVIMLLLLRQSGVRAGIAGLFAALLIVVSVDRFMLSSEAVGLALLTGGLTTLLVAYVLFGGLVLFRLLEAGGALATIAETLSIALPDPERRALTLVLGISVFFESATGFGIGIVVSAPLFMALGFRPVHAAILALAGQCAVPWGALGIGTMLGAELTGVSADRIGYIGAPMNAPLILVCGGVALYLSGGLRAVWRRFPELLAHTVLLTATLAAVSRAAGVEIAGIAGGLAVTGAGLGVSRLVYGKSPSGEKTMARPFFRAALPFATLLLTLLITRLVPGMREAAMASLVLEFPAAGFRMSALYHPGFWMLVAGGVAALSLRLEARRIAIALRAAAGQWVWAASAVAGYICFSQVMFMSGMTTFLATAIAGAVGSAYLAMAPFVGGLGGFLTASNAGSNAMFAQFQLAIGDRLGVSRDIIVAAQNAGGANTNMASPGRVVLAAAVTGQTGNEGRLMRPMLAISVAGLVLLAAGLLVWA